MTETVFSRTYQDLGTLTLRRVEPAADAVLLHGWVTHPKAGFWLMQDCDVADVARQYREIHAAQAHDAFLGLHDDRPAFLVERYDPAQDSVGTTYPVLAGDVGMHFLVAPTDSPVHGFTRAVISTVMEMLFADPATERVVVEPDVRNGAVHDLNAAVGFRVIDTVTLPEKRALLSVCTRDDFLSTRDAPHEARG